MSWNIIRKIVSYGWGRFLLATICWLSLAGCGVVANSAPTPEAWNPEAATALPSTPAATAPLSAPTIAPTAPPTPEAPLKPTAAPATTPTITPTVPATVPPTATPPPTPLPFILEVQSPIDGAGVETGAVRVMGVTSGVALNINGVPVSVSKSGVFQHDLSLQEGANLIQVAAFDSLGRTKSQQLVVFVVSSTAGLPFTLFYPSDGLQVSEPAVSVVGVTRPDAVVGVNEVPVESNALGIFSTTIALKEGANLIEVVAADLEGNVRFQTLVVFYIT